MPSRALLVCDDHAGGRTDSEALSRQEPSKACRLALCNCPTCEQLDTYFFIEPNHIILRHAGTPFSLVEATFFMVALFNIKLAEAVDAVAAWAIKKGWEY